MRLINADDSFTINASDNTGYALAFAGGIISCADEMGHIEAEFFSDDIPAVDAAPVVHAEWLGRRGGFFDFATCSNCKEDYPLGGDTLNYCPHCGAKMDKAVTPSD